MLKIRNTTYMITEKDKFLDNGSSVQLMTKGRKARGTTIPPVLSQRAIKEIERYGHIEHEHKYGEWCSLFSLDLTRS